MKSGILAGAALALGAVTLTACGNQSEGVTEAPEGLAGLTIENARLILPAVSGNPAAVYLDMAYDGETPQTLAAVAVEGSDMAMMHEYAEKDFTIQMVPLEKVELTKGTKLAFEPGGKHIMAMNVSPELASGGKTDVTLIFATGDKQSVSVDIRAAGDAR